MTRSINEKFYQRPRVQHYSYLVTPVGAAGEAVAEKYFPTGPGRVTHLKVNYVGTAAATTDIVFTADGLSDGSTGSAFFTKDDNATDIVQSPLGSPSAVDEARNATAATDGTEGGRFVKSGVHIDIHEADPEQIHIEFWFERLRYDVTELVAQSGADGSAVVTRSLPMHGAGVLLGLHVDFQNTPATADLVIQADSSAGEVLITSTSSQTDFGPAALGAVGVDEGGAAVAATDGIGGGGAFRRGLYFDVAQSDAFTSSNEKIVVHTWVRQ